MIEKIEELIANIQLPDFQIANFRMSKQPMVIIAAGGGLVALCLCFIMVSMVGSASGDEEPTAVVEFKQLPTLVPKAIVPGTNSSSLPATNTPRPTPASYATNTPIPTYSEGVGLPYPPGDLARVTQIIDGNTIEVEMNGTTYQVRYIGLDTPEQGAAYYQEAVEANEVLVAGKEVVLVKDVTETDQLSRLMRYVYLTDGTFVNAELVKQGYASAVEQPPDMLHHNEFVQYQQISQSSGLGIWNTSAN